MATLKRMSRALWEKIFPYEVRWGVEEVPQAPILQWKESRDKLSPGPVGTYTADPQTKDGADPSFRIRSRAS